MNNPFIKNLLYAIFAVFITCRPGVASELPASLQEKLKNVKQPSQAIAILQNEEHRISRWPIAQQGEYYNLLALWQEQASELDAAISSYTKVIKLFEQNETTPQLVDAYIERAYIRYLKTYDKAIYCDDRRKALQLARDLTDPELLVKALTALAFCYSSSEQFTKGLKLLSEAVTIASQNSLSPNRQAMIYNATASIYDSNLIYDKTSEYLKKAYDLWASVDDRQDMFNMLHSLVDSEISQGNWQQAERYVDELFKLAKSSPEFSDFFFFAHYNKGILNFKKADFETAITALKNAASLKETTSESYFVRNTFGYLMFANIMLENREQAVKAAEIFLSLSPKLEKEKTLRLLAQAILSLERGNESQGIASLLKIIEHQSKQQVKFTKNAISSASANHNNNIALYENQILKQKLAIQELNLNAVKDKQRIAKQTTLIISLVIATLASLVIFLYYSRRFFKIRSQTDFLTKIANRSYIFEKGQDLLKTALKKQLNFSVIIFDIDHFKKINDNYGHEVGDQAIIAAANQAKHWIRKKDLLGRIGGEEFLILLPESDHHTAYEIAERIRQGVANKTFRFGQHHVSFSISLGVAALTKEKFLDLLILSADKALYQAKKAGRNQSVLAKINSETPS